MFDKLFPIPRFSRSLFILLISLIIFLFISPKFVSADMTNPDYFTSSCDLDEIEVECVIDVGNPYPRTFSIFYNACDKYEKSPNYRFLDSTHGTGKYCYKSTSVVAFVKYHMKKLFPLLLITLLIELPIFLIFRFKNIKNISVVILANLISIPLFYVVTIVTPFKGLNPLIFMELVVVIFEAILIKFFLKGVSFKKVLVYSFAANFASAFIGILIINLVINPANWKYSNLKDTIFFGLVRGI